MIVTDSDGRAIDVRPLSLQEEMTLAAATGGVADGVLWWGRVKQACSVRSIAGALIHMPQTRGQIKTLTKRIGVAGLRVVIPALNAWVAEPVEPAVIEFTPVDEVELIDLLEIGGQLADIPTWRGVAWLAAGIRKIGDEVLEFPKDMDALHAAVTRMDEPAIRAALESRSSLVTDNAPQTVADEAEAAKN